MENFENSSQVESTETQSVEAQSSEQPSVVDIGSLERFKYNGREMTPKEFGEAYLRHEDYSRKTQAIAEERKYYENLNYDLEAVKNNPALADKFKQIYPEKYHGYLKWVASEQSATNKQVQEKDPEQSFKEEFYALKKEINEQKISAINAELDAKFTKFLDKFPYADEEAVVARAQVLLDKGEKLTDKVWESLFKASNDRTQGIAEKHYSDKFKKQNQANLKGKDVPAGGATPGAAPVQPRSIKAMTNHLFASGMLEN